MYKKKLSLNDDFCSLCHIKKSDPPLVQSCALAKLVLFSANSLATLSIDPNQTKTPHIPSSQSHPYGSHPVVLLNKLHLNSVKHNVGLF